MTWAYFDESINAETSVMLFGGCVASQEAWEAFTVDWRNALRTEGVSEFHARLFYTYNGESHGHWEGDTLVVETRYIETWNHYIDSGIPISEDFRVIERMRLLEDGEVLEIEIAAGRA